MSLVERVSFRDSDHSYHLDGRRLPSVTTILGNLSKPGLTWWAAKLGAEVAADYLRGQMHHEDALHGPYAIVNEGDVAHLSDLISTAHNKRLRSAGDKGNRVHAAIDQFQTDFWNAEPPDAELEPAAYKAWCAFLEWWQGAGLTCVATERKIVDPEGRYAGRLDMLLEANTGWDTAEIAWGDGRTTTVHPSLYVADVKTSGGIYPEHVYQNAGYAAAIEAEIGREVAGTKVLWLPEGAEKLIVIERDRAEWQRDFEIFASLIPVHSHRAGLDRWLREIKETHGPKDEQ